MISIPVNPERLDYWINRLYKSSIPNREIHDLIIFLWEIKNAMYLDRNNNEVGLHFTRFIQYDDSDKTP